MKMTNSLRWRTALMATSLFSLATPAIAQDTPRPGASASDEIVVVATRREQPLQTVPLAVTALGEEQLALQQVTSIEDIGTLTPNLIATPGTAGGSRSSPLFAIRGQSQQERGGLADSSVAVYFNDVVMARTQGLNQNLYDVRSVEVIRGPVGTLFGRNATGGAVIIRPNLPEIGEFNFGGGATLAELGRREFDGYVNIPVNDHIAFRFAAGSTNSDGYIYDTALGRNINNENSWSARASLRVESGNFSNTFLVGHFDENDGGSGGHAVHFNTAASPNNPAVAGPRNYPTPNGIQTLQTEQAALGDYRIANGLAERNIVSTWDVQNTTTFELSDNLTLKNIIGYRHVDSDILVDLDGTRLPLLHSEIFDNAEQWTEEFQILGTHGNFDWIAGAYYFFENGDNDAASVVFGVDPGAIELTNLHAVTGALNNRQQFENVSTAVFAEVNYNLDNWLDGLSVTVGGRQTWDERSATILNRNVGTTCRFTVDHDDNPATPEINPGAGPLCRVDANAEFDAFTYNLGVNWQADENTLLYASYRRGFRSGGFQARATTEAGLRRANDPEWVNTLEVGLKRDWELGDAFLRTNIALFHSDYSDIQRQINDSTQTPPFSVTVNAAEATVQGIELEVLFRPIEQLEFSGFWGYTDASFDSFIDPFSGADLSNATFSRTPENTWRISGSWDIYSQPRFGDVRFTAAYWGRDEYLTVDNTTIPALDTVPAYEQLDLYLQWRHIMDSNLDATLFVRNVEDAVEYSALGSVYSLGVISYNVNEPRTIGLQLSYDLN
jgi:iron complex outermembrane receptor protein